MLQECLEVGPRQHSDPSGSISTPNPDEGPGRVQGMPTAKYEKRTQYRQDMNTSYVVETAKEVTPSTKNEILIDLCFILYTFGRLDIQKPFKS